MIPRAYAKKSELLAWIYDYNKGQTLVGVTLGWSDGKIKNWDGYKGKDQAHRQMNNVIVELIRQVISLGVFAKYVLFDSWFLLPKITITN